jgi:hypothetical protein
VPDPIFADARLASIYDDLEEPIGHRRLLDLWGV